MAMIWESRNPSFSELGEETCEFWGGIMETVGIPGRRMRNEAQRRVKEKGH